MHDFTKWCMHIERERLLDRNKCNYNGGHTVLINFYITLTIYLWDFSTLCVTVCDQLYYVPHMACSAIFRSIVQEGIMFSWFRILGLSLTSARLNTEEISLIHKLWKSKHYSLHLQENKDSAITDF